MQVTLNLPLTSLRISFIRTSVLICDMHIYYLHVIRDPIHIRSNLYTCIHPCYSYAIAKHTLYIHHCYSLMVQNKLHLFSRLRILLLFLQQLGLSQVQFHHSLFPL